MIPDSFESWASGPSSIPMEDPVIVIGAYGMPSFVHLNLEMCSRIFPDSPILVSDDLSPWSWEIESLAEEYGAAYQCSTRRRTHCSGDWQAFVNGSAFGIAQERWVLKLSQRFVPRLPEFREKILSERKDHQAVLPGRIQEHQIARPGARFYLCFGHLTDCVLFDPRVFTPAVLKAAYDKGMTSTNKGDKFSELAWARLMSEHRIHRVDWLANQPPQQKLYLRKASASEAEYQDLAKSVNVGGSFDIREWKQIEGANYRSIPK